MVTSWQKKILFFIYFFITTVVPILSLKQFIPQDLSFLEVGSVGVGILVIIGSLEWKLMPSESSKILAWFLCPIVILVFNFLYFGKSVFFSLLHIDGIAIMISIILASVLIDFKQELLNNKVAKENVEKFKTPFLHSYWRRKYSQSFFNDSIVSFLLLSVLALVGVVICGYIVIRSLPYPENIRFIVTFLMSVTINMLAFYKARFLKYES